MCRHIWTGACTKLLVRPPPPSPLLAQAMPLGPGETMPREAGGSGESCEAKGEHRLHTAAGDSRVRVMDPLTLQSTGSTDGENGD